MAEQNFDVVETHGRKKRLVMGSFVPNGSSAIDNTKNTGENFTVAYTTTGVYTVTIPHKFGSVVGAHVSLRQATRSQDVYPASCDGQTLVIHGFAVGSTSLADITAATGTTIDFVCVMDDKLPAL